MRQFRRRLLTGRATVIAGLAVLSWQVIGPEPLLAQQMQYRLPAFQDPARGDLETEILNRLSETGEYEPGDLQLLARLAVLESISTLVNVRADMLGTVTGIQLEGELTTLWDASQSFYEIVSSAPLDQASLTRADEVFADVIAAQRSVDSTLGALPAMSTRANDHFQNLSRLLADVSPLIGSIESDLLDGTPPVASRAANLETMREQSQLLANDLVGLIDALKEEKPGRVKQDAAVVAELNDLLVLVQDFSRSLALDLPPKEAQASFRAARRRMWHVEARIIHLAWPASLDRQWRTARGRMNAISDEFGLPRVIVSAPVVQPADRKAPETNRGLVAHLDHAVAWLDQVLAEQTPDLRQTPTGARFVNQTAQMRVQLLQLRRRAIANEPADKLLKSLNEIEQLNQQISDHASDLAQQKRTGLAARYKNPAAAVSKLRSLVAKN
jgi:hypothetical protein